MRILISSVGTRGDVQPAMALAVQVRELGHQVRMCVPPNFLEPVSQLGFEAVPMGVEMRAPRAGAKSSTPATMPDLMTDQFDVAGSAARDCNLIVGGGVHQYAAPSIAELLGIPFVDVVYAPVSLPSAGLAPAGYPEDQGRDANLRWWEDCRRRWNERSLEHVNINRARLGLAPVSDVLNHILGARPWLAADQTLGPALPTFGMAVIQTGAWILPGPQALPPELEAFLDAGEPPVYLGFGSMPAAESMSRMGIEAARAAGRRVVLSRGWAGLGLIDSKPDCIAIGDVNHQALFPRVAAAVHHGGAGTTAAAALAGISQVTVPLFGDQFYWSRRVRELGVGSSAPAGELTAEVLARCLQDALAPAAARCAQSLARKVCSQGAAVAALRLVEEYG